jgi:hypothetical protein
MTALAAGYGEVTWLQKDIPMNLHLFEYIARNSLLKWWASCASRDSRADSDIKLMH